jgi:small subunit ribosomal protein S3
VDYGFAEADTTYGVIGVKVWIFKGEVFDLEEKSGTPGQEKAAGA